MPTQDHTELQAVIEAAWADREALGHGTKGAIRDAVLETIERLDAGTLRVAEREADGTWITHQWAKQAILLFFRLTPNSMVDADAAGPWWDKVPLKFTDWDAARFEAAGFRAVAGSVVRTGSFLAKGVVSTPSFVNIGAYVGEGTTSSRYLGHRRVLRPDRRPPPPSPAESVLAACWSPLQASPTIIEDNCFIGARSEVAEGVIVREGSSC